MGILKTISVLIGLLFIVLGFYYSLITGNYLVTFTALILGFIFVFMGR